MNYFIFIEKSVSEKRFEDIAISWIDRMNARQEIVEFPLKIQLPVQHHWEFNGVSALIDRA